MSLRLTAARSLVWTILESGGLSVLSFITLVVVARIVTPAELGIFAAALSIVQLLTLFVEMLFHDALVQRPDTNQGHYDTAFTVSLIIAILLCTSSWMFSELVSNLLNLPRVGYILSILSIGLIFSAFGSTLVARQRREFSFKALALRSLIGRLLGSGVGITAAVMGAGIWSLVAQQLVMTGCASAILWFSTPMRPRLNIIPGRIRDMAGFGLTSLANILIMLSESRIFLLMVAYSLGPASAGFLNLAFRVVDMPRDVISGAASQLALPLFRNVSSDRTALTNAYVEAVSFTCAIGYPIFFGLAACAPEIIEIMFGLKWFQSINFTILFALLTVVHFPKLYASTILSALGKPQFLTPVLTVSLLTVFIGMLTIGTHALWIAALVWAIRLVTSKPIEIFLIKRASGITLRQQLQGAGAPFLAASIMAAIVWFSGQVLTEYFSPFPRLIMMSIVGVFVYIPILALLDLRIIKRLVRFAQMMNKK
ncbi:oligosaccharide flippase family protein [Methylobacterium sp. HMF5984]|uniref:oligosaccharide flippase family protein n=1 Tax=Methylobacterium sp. HMF5984 TaxID=3367370 RepID=UPI0038538671